MHSSMGPALLLTPAALSAFPAGHLTQPPMSRTHLAPTAFVTEPHHTHWITPSDDNCICYRATSHALDYAVWHQLHLLQSHITRIGLRRLTTTAFVTEPHHTHWITPSDDNCICYRATSHALDYAVWHQLHLLQSHITRIGLRSLAPTAFVTEPHHTHWIAPSAHSQKGMWSHCFSMDALAYTHIQTHTHTHTHDMRERMNQ